MQETVRQDRHKYIGGSDIPAIMELSSFKRRYQLLLEKAQLANDEFPGNEYTRYGEEMEPKIRDYINTSGGYDFKEDVRTEEGTNIGKRYHADGYDEGMQTVLEIKTTSHIYEDVSDYQAYLAQLLFGMEMFGCEKGALAVYERPSDFNATFDENRLTLYHIHKSDFNALETKINASIDIFIGDLQAISSNPFLSDENLPSRKEIAPLANRIEALEQQLQQYKELEREYNDMRASLKTAMEKKGIKSWQTDNGVRFTLVPDGKDKEVTALDEKILQKEQPTIWEQYQKTTIKKGRRGYVSVTLPKQVSHN